MSRAKLMTDPFFAIRLLRRYGSAGTIALALLVAVGLGWLLWLPIGWLSFPLGTVAGALTFIVGRSYVEVVSMIFERLN